MKREINEVSSSVNYNKFLKIEIEGWVDIRINRDIQGALIKNDLITPFHEYKISIFSLRDTQVATISAILWGYPIELLDLFW